MCRTLVLILFIGSGVVGCQRMSADAPRRVTNLHGLTESQVTATLGPPVRTHEFTMAECCDEFRVELYNTYPPDEAAHAEVRIRELWWKDGEYWVTVWLHRQDAEWIVLDSLRWHKELVF